MSDEIRQALGLDTTEYLYDRSLLAFLASAGVDADVDVTPDGVHHIETPRGRVDFWRDHGGWVEAYIGAAYIGAAWEEFPQRLRSWILSAGAGPGSTSPEPGSDGAS